MSFAPENRIARYLDRPMVFRRPEPARFRFEWKREGSFIVTYRVDLVTGDRRVVRSEEMR